MSAIRPLSLLSLLSLAGLVLGACGDFTSSTGALGRVNYSLHSDYEIDPTDLKEVEIITGYTQFFNVSLTEDGEDLADEPQDIFHRIEPSGGTVIQTNQSDSQVPDFSVSVENTGVYRISSMLDNEVFDYIDIAFERPSDLDVIAWTREATEDEFTRTNDAEPVVQEGAQAAFMLVPLNEHGDRIIGDFDPKITADPDWMIVVDYDVIDAYEDRGVVGAMSTCSIYFLEPGSVTLSLEDEQNDISTTMSFKVEERPHE